MCNSTHVSLSVLPLNTLNNSVMIIVREPMGSVGTIRGGQFCHAFPERYMSIDCILV